MRLQAASHVMSCDLEERFRVDERLLSVALVLVRESCVCVCVCEGVYVHACHCVCKCVLVHVHVSPNSIPTREY